jgi:hypothetical protein
MATSGEGPPGEPPADLIEISVSRENGFMNSKIHTLICLWCVLMVSDAWCAAPSVESVWPPVGQRGTEFELKIVGSGFEGCRDLTFYSAELRCKKIEVVSDYELTATVIATENCRIGNEPFRLLGRDGYSELRTLRVTPLPVVLPAAKQPSEATQLQSLNVTLCGAIKAGSIDRYAVDLKAGQRLTAEVEAIRLGKELLDTVLEITAPSGEVLMHADDNAMFYQDPIASIIAPSDGRYVIQVHEANYGGGESSFYALHVGDFGLPSVAYPAGGQVGTALQVRFIGSNDSEQIKIDLPNQKEQPQSFQLFGNSSNGISPSPIPFRLSDFLNVLESDDDKTNDSPNDIISAFPVPIALNGILASPGDIDCFAFEASDATPLRIDAFAGRIGSPMDSLLTIMDSS